MGDMIVHGLQMLTILLNVFFLVLLYKSIKERIQLLRQIQKDIDDQGTTRGEPFT